MSVSSITETSQYLTFKLEDEVFALDIGKVREVLDFTSVAKVPQTPDFMLGVINLRGTVVPVVDMRLKFAIDPDGNDGKYLHHHLRDRDRRREHRARCSGRFGAGSDGPRPRPD